MSLEERFNKGKEVGDLVVSTPKWDKKLEEYIHNDLIYREIKTHPGYVTDKLKERVKQKGRRIL